MSIQAQLAIRSYSAAAARHAHEFHQLIFPVEGDMQLDVDGVAGRVAGDRAALVVGGAAHEFRAPGPNRFVILDLPMGQGAMLPDRALGQAAAQPFFALDAGLRHLVLYAAHALGAGALPRALARNAVDLVVDAVMRARGDRPIVDPAVERAVALIHARYAEPLTTAALAEAACLSASALHPRFRDATGRTPFAYLSDVRLDAALRLLRTSRLPIAEIALAVGFSDQTALTRCLRRRRGVTPAAARCAG